MTAPEPGDVFVTDPGGRLFWWIELGEKIIDRELVAQRKKADLPVWGHAGVASRYVGTQLMIVQAEPGGAVEVPWNWGHRPYLWSTGILPPCPAAASAALMYAGYMADGMGWVKTSPGVGYSFLDYLAIETHALHIPAPGLQHYIRSTRHMICSQLADQCRLDGGSHLFHDRRWPGYVSPFDIGLLLEGLQ